jgi:hypothetical protein
MDAYFVLAESHAKSTPRDVAFSARPDAPVLPYVAPRRPVRRFVGWLRGGSHGLHRPTAARPARQARAPGRIVGWHE